MLQKRLKQKGLFLICRFQNATRAERSARRGRAGESAMESAAIVCGVYYRRSDPGAFESVQEIRLIDRQS